MDTLSTKSEKKILNIHIISLKIYIPATLKVSTSISFKMHQASAILLASVCVSKCACMRV